MKILITGNMGYVGPVVTKYLRNLHPDAVLIGLDTGFFGNCLTTNMRLPESLLDMQLFADVRDFPKLMLEGVDAIVHLAGISNDPIGNVFEESTQKINHLASIDLARLAKEYEVRSFVFASSCSIYGAAENESQGETAPLKPLTAYARSKVDTERDLEKLASDMFKVTCLRFSTACGMSDRLRLDLVLNDFVAAALTSGKITILSDGTPWRPLIHVEDMARAIDWAIDRSAFDGGHFLSVNVGSNEWNYQVKDLAEAVAGIIPGTTIEISKTGQPDRRSYRVNFDLFSHIAPGYQPQHDLTSTIMELKSGLEKLGFNVINFRDSKYTRLSVLRNLQRNGFLDEKLYWISG